MVFDEVDSGVGGGVAEMVGRRLQELGASRQVLCVTHLPQVASLASQHFRISKVTDGKATRTRLTVLGKEERIEELARMLGDLDVRRIAPSVWLRAAIPQAKMTLEPRYRAYVDSWSVNAHAPEMRVHFRAHRNLALRLRYR